MLQKRLKKTRLDTQAKPSYPLYARNVVSIEKAEVKREFKTYKMYLKTDIVFVRQGHTQKNNTLICVNNFCKSIVQMTKYKVKL